MTEPTRAPERLVDAKAAGKFLGFTPDVVRRMAKAKQLPHYEYGLGSRTYYRFRLSELASADQQQATAATAR